VTIPVDVREEFNLSVHAEGADTVLRLHGELDTLSAPHLRSAMDASIDAGNTEIVVDLTALTFMDAAGLRVIAHAANRLELVGGTLAIRNPSEIVRRILEITGMTDLAELYPRGSN
jgi:anti-sigma B factor antagonist